MAKVIMPQITDSRKTLPRHPTHKWGRRKLEEIRGICVHQTAGGDSVTGTANYHVGPNHISNAGCPAICYTYYIDQKGTIHWCNDHEDVTWSQGGQTPLPNTRGNYNFLAIACGGDFDGQGHAGCHVPTRDQLDSLRNLVEWLLQELGLNGTDVYGHYHFGKPACPGNILGAVVESLRTKGLTLPETDVDWQSMLVALGYDLGKWGVGRDGIDGEWGNDSRQALVAFQRVAPVHVTGYKDALTATELAFAYSSLASLATELPTDAPPTKAAKKSKKPTQE